MKYITIQHLLESSDGGEYGEQVAEASKWMTENAQPWISAVEHNVMKYGLFRGSHKRAPTVDWIVNTVRLDRQPRGMPKNQMSTWEKYIDAANKIANRRNSWMATGDQYAARQFGRLNLVIPMGEFNYTWIAGVGDLNHWYWDRIQTISGEIKSLEAHDRFFTGQYDFDIRGDDHSLIDAIEVGAEVMICPKSQKAALFDPAFMNDVVRHMLANK